MRSGFFNSEIIGYDAENMPVFDRAEDASFFAKYFSQFISNGVFPNPSTNMQVLADSGMNVKVDIGVCYINGYMGWVEPAETLEIEESDTQSRIDRIVARLDFDDRSISLAVKKGTAQGNPVAPEVQRDYDIYEIALADIRVNANVIEITQENITDLRLNTELCGIVANQLQHVDTTTLFNQYQSWYERVTGEAERNIADMEEQFENDFNTWFATIQDILDEDTAGHLYNLINTKSNKKLTYNTTIDTEWTGEQAPYTKTINLEGMQSTYIPQMDLIYSNDIETAMTEKEEYSKISKIESGQGSVTLTCFEEVPSTSLNVRIEVVF